MQRKHFINAAALSLLLHLAAPAALAQTTLRVFSGGANQRPDLMRKLFDRYEAANPGVKIQIETGGATSELQRQYLSTLLNAKDSTIDVILIDIINPAQYYGAGWLEPLDAYLGPAATALQGRLPVYLTSAVVNGKLAALPAFADAMLMYYRRDLLDKYKIAEPKTWDELATAARRVQKAEGNPNLQGLSIQGAPSEGAVCTFLLPYWSQGREFNDASGKLTLDRVAATRGLQQWLTMVDQGVIKRNVAEVKTPDTVNEFKTGQVIFAINWAWAWDRFQDDADSKVKGRVGVMPMPAMTSGKSATCIGGWLWAVSAFSKNKAASAKLVQFMGSRDSSRFLAVEGVLLPVYPDIYGDAEVLKHAPWFKDAAEVVAFGRSRPMSARYGEVSDTLRTVTSAVLARTLKPEDGVAQIERRLKRVMR